MVGNSSLPLTAEATDAILHLLDDLPGPIGSVYRAAGNEACDQVAQIVARKHQIRPRDNPDLDELRMGLWQGLLPDDIRARFPTVYPQWEQQPLAVTPPDGEPMEQAIRRIRGALNRILRRSKGQTVALALRPMAFQIARGILRIESPNQIAERLRERAVIETIEIDPAAAKALLA
jgi:broad specificity phosphatase PhoE